MMPRFPPDSDSPPFLPYVLGLASSLTVMAIILGLLAYSLVTALGLDLGLAAGAAGGSSSANPRGMRTQPLDVPIASALPVSSTVILCNGRALFSAGRGTIYHSYIQELLNEADHISLPGGRVSRCVRTGLGSDDFR